MPIQKNLNVSPYYDDFDPKKNYHRVLYKAGYPIQARELTTQQSILQDQIEQLFSRILSEGDNVVPGEFSIQTPVYYVRLSSFTNGTSIQDFVGFTLTGVTSGVVAECTFAVDATSDDDATLYVTYLSSGESKENLNFLEGEVLESSNPNAITANVGVNTVSKPITSTPMGQGALFRVSEGSYFIDGMAVRNTAQRIVISKYTDRFDAKVGFLVTESVVTSNEDSSLLDNSQGSSNFAAPGADRLKIELTLVARPSDVTDPNFILLAEVIQGNIIATPGDTVKWDWLYDILARRTFDESGNYIVSEFAINTLEYYNDDNVDGLYNPDADGKYPPIPGSDNTLDITFDQASQNYVVNVSAGKAYVQGYEIDLRNRTYLYGEKARETSFRSDTLTQITEGYNISITNVYGTPDFQNISGDGSAIAFDDVVLFRNFIDGFVGQSVDANDRPLNIGNEPWNTFHIVADGPIGSNPTGFTEIYKTGNGAVVNTNTTIQRGDAIGNATVLVATEIKTVPSGVIRPRYMLPQQQVDDNNGFYGYASTSKLGIMNAVYFTELAVIGVTNASTGWVVGDKVVGELSGAVGVVEQGADAATLILSNVVGEFREGEEVIQGDKVSRILKETEAAKLRFDDKGTSNNTIDLSSETGITFSALGSSLALTVAGGDLIAGAAEIKLTEQGRTKLLNFPYPDGSIQQAKINIEGVTVPNGVKSTVITRTPKVSNTLSLAKSFFSALSDTNDFSADIASQSNADAEIIDIANGSLYSAVSGEAFLTCDNYSGDASEQLFSGDIITFVDDAGVTQTRTVQFATTPSGSGEVRSQGIVWLTVPVPTAVTGKTVQRIRVKTKGSSKQTLLYQLPQQVVKTLETNPDDTNLNYQVTREFIANVSSGASTITLTTNKTNERFLADSTKTFIVIAENISSPSDPAGLEGRALVANNIDVSQDNGRKIVYTLDQNLSSSVKVKVLTPVFVVDSKSRRKIARTAEQITVSTSDAQKEVISLGKADVYNVTSVMMGTVNILDNYEFDNGQRDNFYDISRLVLKSGRPVASAELKITFDYFEHSGDGDFFSVDSYTDDNGVGYENVPTYTSSNIVTQESIYSKSKDKNTIFLRDALDFRPIVNMSGSNPSVIVGSSTGIDAQGSKNFRSTENGGDAFAPRIPLVSTQFACDLEYYLPKVDSVFLEPSGKLTIVAGESANDPVPPIALSSAIRLYDLHLPPYTFNLTDIFIEKFNYKRYQMKDIAVIDRKVQNLTELMTLSLLEQDAINMNVRDATTGLDRFKNGIVVDNFSNHGNGDVGVDQYRCSIDPKNQQLRAPFFIDQIHLEEAIQTDEDRKNQGYRLNNDIITVDYTDTPIIEQPLATRFVNLQPYSVFTWKGQLSLFPEIDTFSDKNTLPDVIIEDNTLYDAAVQAGEAASGTVWSDWETSTSSSSASSNGTTVDTSTSVSTQVGISTDVNVTTSEVVNTSLGEAVVDVQVAETMRTIAVNFFATNVKPNTRYYAFFDGIEVTSWVITDTIVTDFPDNVNRYDGNMGGSLQTFGKEIFSDDLGQISGTWLVPNGRAPVVGSSFDGNLLNVQYQSDGPTRSFSTGTRLLKFIDNQKNPDDEDLVGGFAETNFTSSGVIVDVQETIISTKIPQVDIDQSVSVNQSLSTNVDVDAAPPQIIVIQPEANDDDPVAQTFSIPSALTTEGTFVTEVDLYFKRKDLVQGMEVYLVTTEGQVPTSTVIPGSLVNKNTDTTLRVQCTSLNGDSTQILAGTQVVGQTSGATGVLKSTVTFESSAQNSSVNVANHTYNVILNNYNGDFVAGETIVPTVSPALADVFKIANDEFKIERADIKRLGSSYTTATVEFSAPQLPGGVTATGTAKVSDGMVYQIDITNIGSGYTAVPSVTITGDGTGARVDVKVTGGRKAVDMGVATSDDATVPTTFKFPTPVYLFSDTYYAVVAKAPTSLNYECYTAKMGENVIGTETRLVKQPTLGALFMSQNGGLWTEDQTQDITFVLRRAKFNTNVVGNVVFENSPLKQVALKTDPIEFNNNGSDITSDIFGDNAKIIKIYHYMSGLEPGDLVAIDGITGDPGGIPVAEINRIHTVVDSGFEFITVRVLTSATSSGKAGGSSGVASFNRPYEVINITTGMINFGSTSARTTVSTVQAAGCTGYNTTNQYTRDVDRTIKYTTSYYATGAKQVANYLNEAKYFQPLGGARSFRTTALLSTINDFLSPVIDLSRTNASVIRNLVNNPQVSDDIYGTPTTTVTFTGNVAAAGLSAGDTTTFTQDSVARDVSVVDFNSNTGKLKLSGQHTNKLKSSSTWSNSTLEGDIVKSITVAEDNGWYPETDNRGSVYAKWISRLFEFENSCDGIEIKLAAIFYSTSDIKIYYKPRNLGFDGDFAELNWIPFNGTGLPDDVELITPRSSDNVDPNLIPAGAYQELTFTTQDIPAFDAISVKIVMSSQNPALAPLIDDIRMVCSE